MADETLKYDVEIDKESLAAQLQEVRSMIDSTMAQAAWQNDVAPSASIFTGENNPIISAPMVPPSGAFTLPTMQSDNMGPPSTSDLFDKLGESIRVGKEKFGSIARTVGLISNNMDIEPPSTGYELFGKGPEGFFGSLGATIMPTVAGFDYNRSGMTRADYVHKGINNISESLSPLFSGNAFSMMGTALGSFGGLAGAFAGFSIGGTMDLLGGSLGARYAENKTLGKAIRAIAGQNFGAVTSDEADRMATMIQNSVYDPKRVGLDYGMDEIQESLATFANSGGFSNNLNGKDMEKTMSGFISNLRSFSNIMKVTKDEAAGIMAELEKSLVSSTDDMTRLATRLARVGGYVGMNPNDVSAVGQQGVNAFKGTGMAISDAYDIGISQLKLAEDVRRSGAAANHMVQAAGGTHSFAMRQMEATSRYMMSGAGMLTMAGYLGGGNESAGDLSKTISGAIDYAGGSPKKYLELQATMGEKLGALGAEGALALTMSSILGTLDKLTALKDDNGKIDINTAAGAISQMPGMQGLDMQTIKGMIVSASSWAQKDLGTEKMSEELFMRRSFIDENTLSLGGKIGAGLQSIWNPIADNPFTRGVGKFLGTVGEKAGDAATATGAWFSNQDVIYASDQKNLNWGAYEKTLNWLGSDEFKALKSQDVGTPEQQADIEFVKRRVPAVNQEMAKAQRVLTPKMLQNLDDGTSFITSPSEAAENKKRLDEIVEYGLFQSKEAVTRLFESSDQKDINLVGMLENRYASVGGKLGLKPEMSSVLDARIATKKYYDGASNLAVANLDEAGFFRTDSKRIVNSASSLSTVYGKDYNKFLFGEGGRSLTNFTMSELFPFETAIENTPFARIVQGASAIDRQKSNPMSKEAVEGVRAELAESWVSENLASAKNPQELARMMAKAKGIKDKKEIATMAENYFIVGSLGLDITGPGNNSGDYMNQREWLASKELQGYTKGTNSADYEAAGVALTSYKGSVDSSFEKLFPNLSGINKEKAAEIRTGSLSEKLGFLEEIYGHTVSANVENYDTIKDNAESAELIRSGAFEAMNETATRLLRKAGLDDKSPEALKAAGRVVSESVGRKANVITGVGLSSMLESLGESESSLFTNMAKNIKKEQKTKASEATLQQSLAAQMNELISSNPEAVRAEMKRLNKSTDVEDVEAYATLSAVFTDPAKYTTSAVMQSLQNAMGSGYIKTMVIED